MAIGVSSCVCKEKGAIAFWAGPNLVVWARYAFWARDHVATNCRSKKKKARKFKKVALPSRKLSPVLEEEHAVKPKRAKRPSKKSTTIPTT
ncbi:hypothetical protein Tco_0518678, partial [Tanacetum coccineum]